MNIQTTDLKQPVIKFNSLSLSYQLTVIFQSSVKFILAVVSRQKSSQLQYIPCAFIYL